MRETTLPPVRVEADLKERLARYAASQDRGVSWVIRKAIEEYLDRHEDKEGSHRALVTASTVVRLERRPGHARPQPNQPGRNGGSMSTILIGQHQATIYPEDNGYIGAISIGFDGSGNRRRIKRRGRTKAAVKDKLKKAVEALETGIDAGDSYTVAEAVRDWLDKGLKGRDEDTVTANRILAEQHVLPLIGAGRLKELTADQVDDWLTRPTLN